MMHQFSRAINKISSDLQEKENVIGIILFGSLANNQSHEYSDIDLFVIGENEKHRTECFYFETIPVQIIWRSPEVFKEKILKATRTLPISISCKILFDSTGVIKEYVGKAIELSKNGPVKLSSQERVIKHAELSMENQTIKGLVKKGEIASAVILLNQLLLSSIELYYDTHGYYLVSNKHLISDIKRRNPDLGSLAESIILEHQIEEKLNYFDEFRNLILGEIGGALDKYELMW